MAELKQVQAELAQPIRYLLEYTATPYEEKFYICGPAPDYDKSQWINEKDKLGLDFPNLPYLIDGNIKLTQCHAILRHIARKHNLCGESDLEITRVDMLESLIKDEQDSLRNVLYTPKCGHLKGPYVQKIPDKLMLYSRCLREQKWFAGDKITFADFLMYDNFDHNSLLDPKCLDSFPNLEKFMEQFEALEKIDDYMKSSRCIKTPIHCHKAKLSNVM